MLVPTFKRKEDLLSLNLYRGIKVLERASKLNKKVLDGWLGKVMDIS